MLPIFTAPLAFIALLAVPALVAIYWLRQRGREHQVSSLMLWLDERQRREGGRRFERLQTPLLFFLELAILLLIVMAAAGPVSRAGESQRPLVIVLDDSFSLLADREDGARARAGAAIERELRGYAPVRLVLARETPQVLGEAINTPEQAMKQLQGWQCRAPEADLEAAIAFAFELGGARARVLAVTDHAPTQAPNESRLQWWAFGSARPNIAFVNASRTTRDGQEVCWLEIANLSAQASKTTLSVAECPAQNAACNSPASIHQQSIELGPRETRRVTLQLKTGTLALRARLSEDALALDNEVILLPEPRKPVRVEMRVRNDALRALLEKAAQASQQVSFTASDPELVITDQADANAENASAWMLRLISEPNAASFLGPFVVDRAHPLTEGLSLGGVVWGGGKSEQFTGTPIITAGNVPLLTDLERAGKHDVRLRLRLDLSTLHETPNWPILIWNMISWRARAVPGVRPTNVRLGAETALTLDANVESVRVTPPDHQARQLPVRDRTMTVKADGIGVYELDAGGAKYVFASNALRQEESDLAECASGRWGDWTQATALQWEYTSVAWVALLLALLTLSAHAVLAARG